MNDQKNKDLDIDLGSAPADADFDPFASEDDLGGDTAVESAAQPVQTKTPAPQQNKPAKPVDQAGTTANPMENAINAAESNEAEKARQSLIDKLPVFEYAGASENIDDTSKTFDELRIEKAGDFPELDDGKRVSWTVEYGKIIKPVTDVKGTSISKVKADIETSKEFLDALKKAKDKAPVCKVKPRVTAQSKGTAVLPSYKGIFTSVDEAEEAGKVISIVPAKDGKVYEIRNTNMGRFTTPVSGSEMLSDVRAGFIPALPRIPTDLMMKIISFFRYFTQHGADKEALVNIYWDKLNNTFTADAPEQTVTSVSVNSEITGDYINERYIHYMDIHSHNSMKAFFSSVDDNDEKATRLYTVIGRLDKYFPDIKTRISNGGKFLEIDPGEVFELAGFPFPDEWKYSVQFKEPHGNDEEAKSLWDKFMGGAGADEL